MTQANDSIHKFEIAGMGKAPFKVVGFYKIPSLSLAEHNPNAYNNQLSAMPQGFGIGSCAFCGIGLVNNYLIESADGKKSAVGCDCVGKAGDAGLTSKIKEMQRQARREAREIAREAKYQAQLDAQRKANGGKTDAQIREEKIEARNAAITAGKMAIKESLKEVGLALRHANGAFAHDLSNLLREVNFDQISPNMQRIATEIATKEITGARKNSKAYNAEYGRIEAIMNTARADYDKLLNDNPYPA